MKRTLSFLLCLFFVINSSYSQEYIKLMQDKNANFYDIQKSFNDYWEGKPYKKGKGWKQFKRWEYSMEQQVYPHGNITDPGVTYQEHLKFQDQYNSPKGSIKNKNSNWTPIGPVKFDDITSSALGRVHAVTVDPNNSNVIYIGTPAGGCWKSTDAGNSWAPISDHLGSLAISGIAVDPNNSNIIYIATGDHISRSAAQGQNFSIGVMKSTDGGATWNTTGLSWAITQTNDMSRILIHPTNSNVLWVTTNNGLWKTSDAGKNWVKVSPFDFRDMEINPLNPNTLFACTNTSVYKSTDGGNSFNLATSGIPASGISRLSLALTPHDTNYVYVIAVRSSNSGFQGLYRSTDAGNSYVLRADSPNILNNTTNGMGGISQGWYDLALAVSPINKDEVYTGGVNVWKSTNGGSTLTCLTDWRRTSSFAYTHADIHSLDFYGNTLYCGSDGGIYKSTDKGGSFTDITEGVQISQYYRLGTDPNNAGIILAGAQDNTITLFKDNKWTHPVINNDGMECIVDYTNSNIMYAATQNGSIWKSLNGGVSFKIITNVIKGDRGDWVTPYVLDPVNPRTIYVGYHDIWKSTNGGNLWAKISSFPAGARKELNTLTVAPSDSTYIYASENRTMFKTTDGGTNWTDISAGLPNRFISYVTVHNTNPDILWVSLSGYTAGEKVYKTVDGGVNWTNVSVNLPNLPIRCVLYENGTNNGVYVGTELGVYYKNDDLAVWQSFMDGLPNVVVSELEIHYATGKIRASTLGRGLWESDVFRNSNPPVVQFYTPDTVICPGKCATLTNQTINLGQQWKWHFPGGTPSTSTDLNPTVCYATAGNYNVSLTSTNNVGQDSVYAQNYITVQIPTLGLPLPLKEGFESNPSIPTSWSIINDDNRATWTPNTTLGGNGLSSSSVFIDNLSTFFRGKKDYLVTPHLNFSGALNPIMTFDVAYAFRATADTLAVYYSTDCGVTKTLLWEKNGAALSTVNQSALFTPKANQWRNETIDLSAIKGSTAIDFYIENRSGFGNVVYLDNINIIADALGINENQLNNISLYPNPAENSITIKNKNLPIEQIEIYDLMGKIVLTKQTNKAANEHVIELNSLVDGFYIVKIFANNQIFTKNLIKQ